MSIYKHRFGQGFSTIELMIGVVFICIVLLVTIPAHILHVKRAHFNVVIEAADSMRDPVATCAQFLGTINKCDGDTSSSGNVAALSIHNGVINAVGNAVAGSYNYQLTPHYDAAKDFITWTVSGTCLDAGVCGSK